MLRMVVLLVSLLCIELWLGIISVRGFEGFLEMFGGFFFYMYGV